jgi:hypothetical protein
VAQVQLLKLGSTIQLARLDDTSDSARLYSLGLGVGPNASAPGSILLDDPTTSLAHIDLTNGGSSSVAPVSHGRIRYDVALQKLQRSENGGAYVNFGDVTGPASAVDKGLVTFNGTTGKAVQSPGQRFYGASATDPSSPTPAGGDMYYNTALGELMTYDGSRSKWLSVSQMTLVSGRNNNTLAGSFYRGADGIVFGTNIGYPVPKGTLVGFAWSRTDSDAATLEVLVGGSVIATLASSAAGPTFDWSANADFSAGLMQFRNQTGGNITTDVQITAIMKRRA